MINVTKIEIPDGIKFITQWEGYRLPQGKCVIDKTICGCGFTEFCIGLGNPDHTILCSPRITLLDNKNEKHRGDMGFYYYQSDLIKEVFEGQYTGVIPGKSNKRSKNITTEEMDRYNTEKFRFAAVIIRKHYNMCASMGIPCRIICTYDSFHVIKEAIKDQLPMFHVVVDEFQSIFTDAYFKADVENEFFLDLQDVPNVTYLSATPMLKDYLEEIPGFNNIQYYKFIWPKSRITVANVKEFWVSSLEEELSKIIQAYKTESVGRPFKIIGGLPVFSEHAVFYVNSVSMIRRLIIRNHLLPDECNIICSKSDSRTASKVKGIRHSLIPENSEFTIGRIPLEGEPHKKFTFCTSTTYLGADFYHPDGMTYVASDANIQSLVVDIRLDLPQILGRQRLETNPWKNDCIIFYKTLAKDKIISRENFEKNMAEKRRKTLVNLQDYSNMSDETIEYYVKGIESSYGLVDINQRMTQEKKKELKNRGIGGNTISYLGLRTVTVPNPDPKGKPIKKKEVVYNHFLETAERRAWEVSQVDYRTDVSVTRSISDLDGVEVEKFTPEDEALFQKLKETICSITRFDDKLRTYCEAREAAKSNDSLTRRILNYYKGQDLENLYSYFGLEGCRANSFRAGELKKILQDDIKVDIIRNNIYNDLKLKETYSLKSIKEYLANLYIRLGINKTAKASDLENYYEVKEKLVFDSISGKRVRSYQLIAYK